MSSDGNIMITKKLRIFRILRGLSQYDLQDKTGIKNYRLSLIETGRFKPKPEELRAIARALGVTVAALTQDETSSLQAVVAEAYLGDSNVS